MKPKRIILIRHGQSEGNVDKNVYKHTPDYALKLTLPGMEESKEVGKELQELVGDESMFFYVSPMWRTRMTFENILLSLNNLDKVKWIEEPRLREQEWGHLRSKEESAVIDKQRDAYGTFYFRIPDGESAADVYDRVSDFAGTMHRDFEKETFADNAVLITHGMSIRLFLMKWFHWTVEEFEQLANPKNCALVVLELQGNGKYKLVTEIKKHVVKNIFQRPIQIPEFNEK